MRRAVPALLAVLALGALFFLPEASSARLAALQAYTLLAERVGPEPENGRPDPRPTLAEHLLAGPAATRDSDGGVTFSLSGTRVTADPDSRPDIGHALDLRRSLVRGLRQHSSNTGIPLRILGETAPEQEGASFGMDLRGKDLELAVTFDGAREESFTLRTTWTPPGPMSLLPPVLAVVAAVLTRRPILSLLLGVAAGAVLRRLAFEGAPTALFFGAVDVGTRYFWQELVAPNRAMIIGFVVFMLAMVGVMTRSGGIRGLMDAVARRASGTRSTLISSYLMGLVVFFDDYANTILVGSTMRPLTDRFRISREKLAYIVDSTAAPVAGISVFSTWIAFEVSTFSAQLPAAGLSPSEGYAVFLQTIPYSFYCILCLVLVGLVAFTGRDLGPMLTAERRARTTGAVLRPGARPLVSEKGTAMEPAEGVVPNAWRAVLPLLAFVGVTLFEILRGGGAFSMPAGELLTLEGIATVLYGGSGERPLLIGSLAGFAVAALGAARAGIGADVPRAAWRTLSSMSVAFAILYLAWMIGAVCRDDLGTGPYLTALVGDAIDPLLLPAIVFLLAGVIALATGSSWSTMSILLPLVVAFAYNVGTTTSLAETGPESGRLLLVMSIGAVLSGAIFGDHCSPISDTTVLSSIASASDHIDHVRTQAPYALLAMSVALLTGYLPVPYLGLSPWLGLVLGAALLALIVFLRGKKAD